jgi:hypothetical protein
MKITELFNNPKDPIDQILNKDKDKKIDNDEYKFDLGEDLMYFMHHNDDFYRRNMFPVLKVCKNKFDHGKGFSHRLFKPIVIKAYEAYKKEFPLRELKDSLDEEKCEAIAKKIYETELGNMKDGKYE